MILTQKNNGAVNFGETSPCYRANLAQPSLRFTLQEISGIRAVPSIFDLEYFSVNSPTGPFYREKVEDLGTGAHYYY